MTTAIYPGSFDPFHHGHHTITATAAHCFDRVVIAITANPNKPTGLLTPQARADIARASVAALGNVDVVIHHGLIADLARELHADILLRSMGKEHAIELQMAHHNHELAGIPTVFLPPAAETATISSSQIRTLATTGHFDAAAELIAPPARPLLISLLA